MSKQLDSLNAKLKANQDKLTRLKAKAQKIISASASVTGDIAAIEKEIATETEKENATTTTTKA